MERRDVADDEAFELLRAASQSMNVKLLEVAHALLHGRTSI
jgi:AmiR/NasT family two-component response regulator